MYEELYSSCSCFIQLVTHMYINDFIILKCEFGSCIQVTFETQRYMKQGLKYINTCSSILESLCKQFGADSDDLKNNS